MSSPKRNALLLLGALPIPLVAHSAIYLTEEQAVDQILPGEKLTRQTVELTPEEIKLIEDKSGERVRESKLTVWWAKDSKDKKAVIVDQVLGKHEFITFALGVSRDQGVRGLEILEYRETYGHQVREEKWRKQFLGKNDTSSLKLGADITSISGATLSSSHVTSGVRRLLQTYAVLLKRP